MTKAQRYRRAAQCAWGLSTCCTAVTLYQLIVQSNPELGTFLTLLTSLALAAALQYTLTLQEAPLFDGSVPPPWRIDWAGGGPEVRDTVLGWFCVFVDVMSTVGGVYYFTKHLPGIEFGQTMLGLSPSFMTGLVVFITLSLSFVLGTSSESLNSHAERLEAGSAGYQETRDGRGARDQKRGLP